jgi:hypothetical protein
MDLFGITGLREGACTLCDKERPCFVVTCGKGTFADQPVCAKCLERQVKMRQANGEKPSPQQVG